MVEFVCNWLSTACLSYLSLFALGGSALGSQNEREDHDVTLNVDSYFQVSTFTASQENATVVIATHKQTSRMQCVHRCNRDNKCVDVVMTTKGECHLLNGNEKKVNGVGSNMVEKISRIILPGKQYENIYTV